MPYTPKYKQPVSFTQLLALNPVELQEEIKRLENSINYLVKSNSELIDFVEEEQDLDDKAEYMFSVKENIVAIETQKERIEMIHQALEELLGIQLCNPVNRSENSSISSVAQPILFSSTEAVDAAPTQTDATTADGGLYL